MLLATSHRYLNYSRVTFHAGITADETNRDNDIKFILNQNIARHCALRGCNEQQREHGWDGTHGWTRGWRYADDE